MKYSYIVILLLVTNYNFSQKKQNNDCQSYGTYISGHYRTIPKELIGNNKIAFNTFPNNIRLKYIIDNINISYSQNKLSRVKTDRNAINKQDTL